MMKIKQVMVILGGTKSQQELKYFKQNLFYFLFY